MLIAVYWPSKNGHMAVPMANQADNSKNYKSFRIKMILKVM